MSITLEWPEDNEPNLEGAELLFDNASGQYIPQRFAREIKRDCVDGVSDYDWATLDDPADEWYWDAWNNVLDNAVLTNPETGQKLYLYQDGDLWAVPIKEGDN